ncbi:MULTISPECIES: Rv2175c family DNA-binding protein [Promicromonospora]|uniref:Rv2175c family DNA-binding protein n=1 Tax=Promicromonospora TaxID=43676 RepID=UPI00039B97E6|nr:MULTISPECIES: Rv2175c family DNA-binding protein [Promicromonospora]
MTDLDTLVGDWLTLPDLAESLDIEVGKARGLVSDRHVIGIKRGERTTFQVPALFVLPDVEGRPGVIPTLRGTIMVLADAQFTEPEILEWLFTPNDELGERPVDALIHGKRAAVRRVAQTLL